MNQDGKSPFTPGVIYPVVTDTLFDTTATLQCTESISKPSNIVLILYVRLGEPVAGNGILGDVPRAVVKLGEVPRGVSHPARVRLGLPMAAIPHHGEGRKFTSRGYYSLFQISNVCMCVELIAHNSVTRPWHIIVQCYSYG